MKFKEFIKSIVPFNWFFENVKNSMYDHLGKPSATRINGYILTVLLTIAILTSVGIEIYTAYKTGGSISVQMITLITLLMGHHALLFQLKTKGEESKLPTFEKLKELEKNKEKIEKTKKEISIEDYSDLDKDEII